MKRFAAHAIFWSWNLVFLAFTLFGIGPTALAATARAADNLDIPFGFIAYAAVLLATPVVSVILAARVFGSRRKDPEELFRFFFTFEAPLVVLCVVRLFLIHEMNAALAYVFGLLLLSIAVSLYSAFVGLGNETPQRLRIRLVVETMALCVTCYLAACLAFYAVPAFVGLIREFPFKIL